MNSFFNLKKLSFWKEILYLKFHVNLSTFPVRELGETIIFRIYYFVLLRDPPNIHKKTFI